MSSTSERAEPGRLPAEGGLWLLIGAELAIFSAIFTGFVLARGADRPLFDASAERLSVGFGLFNTLVLIVSSWFVVLGVHAVRNGAAPAAARLFTAAAVGGLAFIVAKCFEWGQKLDAGLTPSTDAFFNYYFALTGLHLMHVLGGLALLGILVVRCRDDRPPTPRHVEAAGCFWHFVDIVWLVLFPLLYLTH